MDTTYYCSNQSQVWGTYSITGHWSRYKCSEWCKPHEIDMYYISSHIPITFSWPRVVTGNLYKHGMQMLAYLWDGWRCTSVWCNSGLDHLYCQEFAVRRVLFLLLELSVLPYLEKGSMWKALPGPPFIITTCRSRSTSRRRVQRAST